MDTLTLFDDTIGAFVLPAAPPEGSSMNGSPPEGSSMNGSPPEGSLMSRQGVILEGWVKTYQKTGTNPLPTLLVVAGDGNEYRPARFELARGVKAAQWPLSGCTGIRAPGAKELVCLYDAVKRGLAWEVAL